MWISWRHDFILHASMISHIHITRGRKHIPMAHGRRRACKPRGRGGGQTQFSSGARAGEGRWVVLIIIYHQREKGEGEGMWRGLDEK